MARDDEHIAPNVFHNTWASSSLARVNGQPLVFFCGGNGIIYAFKPVGQRPPPGKVFNLEKVFQFDFDPTAPKTDVHKYNTNRRESPSNIYGMPVCQGDRLYVAGGGDIWWGKNEAWLKCIDVLALTRGSAALAPSNGERDRTRGLVWAYPLEKHVMSTPAVKDHLVFIADCGRRFHCVDAKTGLPLWTHEIKGEAWASPYVADGKVYLGTRSGNFYVFAAVREKKILSELELDNPISATATAANGVLYVATMTDLYAVQSGAQEK